MSDPDRLRQKLQSIPAPERLDFLADLPAAEQVQYKRILGPDDVKKLNAHIDRRRRDAKKVTVESWLAEARAGRATTPDAMVEVLREVFDRLRPQDADWIRRIDATASAGSFSKRQREVISGIYARYFRPEDA